MHRALLIGFTVATLARSSFAQAPLNEGANDFAASIETTCHIAPGETVTGTIGQPDDKDWCSINLASNQVVWVMLKRGQGAELKSPRFTLYGPDGSKRYSTDSRDRDFVFTLIAREPERFFVEAAGYEASIGSYTLTAGTLAEAVGSPPTGAPTPTQDEAVAPGEWLTSFPTFSARVRERAASFGPTFGGGSLGLLKSFEVGGCSSARTSMSGFGQVQFHARFRTMAAANSTQRIAHGSDFVVDMEIDGSAKGGVGTFVYPAGDSVESWRSLKAGAKIEFTATVNCILNVDMGALTQVVTLHGARPVASGPQAGQAPAKAGPRDVAPYWIDGRTDLAWMRTDNGSDIGSDGAATFCRGLKVGGFTDWRLPTIDELEKLYDPKRDAEFHISEPLNVTGDWVWSSSEMKGTSGFWKYNFRAGQATGLTLGDSVKYRALCVRRSK